MKVEDWLSVATAIAALYFCWVVIFDFTGAEVDIFNIVVPLGVIVGLLTAQVVVLRWKRAG